MYNYEGIKDLAKQAGRKITDFLALAPGNDPFYVGTPADIKAAEWFADIWERAGYQSGVHLRRVHYWAVSQDPAIAMPDGLPYANTERCWDFIVSASKKARYLDLVRIDKIIDNKNPQPHIHATYNISHDEPGYSIYLPNLEDPYVTVYGLDHIDIQPYHLEIWCEKSTMNDVLLPLGREFNANVVTFEGEVSITACNSLVERIKASGGKPTRVWYISDFDPAGNSMPVAMSRKVEFLLNDRSNCCFHLDIKIKPALLTAEQIKRYKLPRIPIKETEKRAASFEAAFGRGAVELDALEALHPGRLQALLSHELETYYSAEAQTETEEQEGALRQAISQHIAEITSRYQAEIATVRKMFDEIRAIKVDPEPYKVGRYEPHVDEDDDKWLFDSERPYAEQIGFYKRHKGVELASIA